VLTGLYDFVANSRLFAPKILSSKQAKDVAIKAAVNSLSADTVNQNEFIKELLAQPMESDPESSDSSEEESEQESVEEHKTEHSIRNEGLDLTDHQRQSNSETHSAQDS
jgi:hypothetical protein